MTTRILLTIALISSMALSISACNTFHGFGQDMSQAGNAISNAAK